MSSDHTIESYKDASGEWRWRIWAGNKHDIVADSGQGYTRERDSLTALFGIYFGQYDESFLEVYGKWQSYAGVEHVPEPYVKVSPLGSTPDAGTPEGEATAQVSAEDTPGYEKNWP